MRVIDYLRKNNAWRQVVDALRPRKCRNPRGCVLELPNGDHVSIVDGDEAPRSHATREKAVRSMKARHKRRFPSTGATP